MSEIKRLYELAMSGEASPEDREALLRLLAEPGGEEESLRLIGDAISEAEINGQPLDEDRLMAIHSVITASGSDEKSPNARVVRGRFLRRWSWAAAVIVAIAGAAIFLHEKSTPTSQQPATAIKPLDHAPGREGAVLTLADGSQVLLDTVKNGVIALQGGARAKVVNGVLLYENTGSGEIAYNTMSTPRGRQFRLTLPDGTDVWLNAGSSIRYPTVFSGNERKVDITGEVYFEVAANSKQPFHVNVGNRTEVEVLGTSFNINSYENEGQITTTLLQGAVRVSQRANAPEDVVLLPGQQALSATADGQIRVNNNADLKSVMAWKRGFFNLENATLPKVMRMLERWYDVTVVYENGVPDVQFGGEISKNIPLSGIVKALREMEVNVKIEEGKKLIVYPKDEKD